MFYNWFLILSVVNLITDKIYIIDKKKNGYFPNLWNSIAVLKEWETPLKEEDNQLLIGLYINTKHL